MLVIDMGPYDAILALIGLNYIAPCSVIGATKPSLLHMMAKQSPSKASKPHLYKPHPSHLLNSIRLPRAMTPGPLSCFSKPLNPTLTLQVPNSPT